MRAMKPEARHALLQDVRTIVAESGFESLRLTVGQDRTLRLVLDHPARRVTVEDTTRMNLRLRKALAARGHPMDEFTVEIESPGADRALTEPRHYARFRGERVRVVRRGEGLKQRVLVGVITAASERGFTLKPEDGPALDLVFADVAEARLDPALPF
jgi:ribosome maturation factor RimP